MPYDDVGVSFRHVICSAEHLRFFSDLLVQKIIVVLIWMYSRSVSCGTTRQIMQSGYAMHSSRSPDVGIRVYDDAGNLIETHEHAGDFKEP
jgi:hypothetical protein